MTDTATLPTEQELAPGRVVAISGMANVADLVSALQEEQSPLDWGLKIAPVVAARGTWVLNELVAKTDYSRSTIYDYYRIGRCLAAHEDRIRQLKLQRGTRGLLALARLDNAVEINRVLDIIGSSDTINSVEAAIRRLPAQGIGALDDSQGDGSLGSEGTTAASTAEDGLAQDTGFPPATLLDMALKAFLPLSDAEKEQFFMALSDADKGLLIALIDNLYPETESKADIGETTC